MVSKLRIIWVYSRLRAVDELLETLRREHREACERALELEQQLKRANAMYRTDPRVSVEIETLKQAMSEAQRTAAEAERKAAARYRQVGLNARHPMILCLHRCETSMAG